MVPGGIQSKLKWNIELIESEEIEKDVHKEMDDLLITAPLNKDPAK